MNYKDKLKEKLEKYSKEDIIITNHAEEQAIFRNLDLDEVKENIVNPQRLVFAEEQNAQNPKEEKYNCYFSYSNSLCHRYVLTVNSKCVVCTLIKIKRRWQKMVEKHAKL